MSSAIERWFLRVAVAACLGASAAALVRGRAPAPAPDHQVRASGPRRVHGTTLGGSRYEDGGMREDVP